MRFMSRRIALTLGLLLALGLGALWTYQLHASSRLEAAMERYEEEIGPLEPSAYQPPDVAEGKNAAVYLTAGAQTLELTGEDRALLTELSSAPVSEWSVESWEALAAIETANVSALELLGRAAPLTESSFGLDYSQGFEIELPGFMELLSAARLLAVQGRARVAEGDLDGALDSARLLERFAASMEREPLLIFLLLGNAIENLYLDLAHQLLKAAPNGNVVERVKEDLDHLEEAAVPPARAFAAEGAVSFATMRGRPESARTVLLRGIDDLFEAAPLEVYAELAQAAELPYPEFSRRLQRDRPRDAARVGSVRQIFRDQLIPNMHDGVEKIQATRSARALARLAAELSLHALQQGSYPEGLSEVVAEPPTSLYSGEPVTYEALPDGSAYLGFPQAQKLERERSTDRAFPVPRLEWELPAV